MSGVRAESVRLSFARVPGAAVPFTGDLSAVTLVGDDLWLGTDEGTGLARLSPVAADAYEAADTLPLEDQLDLPGPEDEEVDVEGLGYAGGFLWLTGSHSRRRADIEPDGDLGRRLRRLSRVKRGGNRFVLARVPLAQSVGRAARLPGGRRRNLLIDLLRDDDHLARFLRIPGKDNGFNVEGLAATEDRLLLGLRGPVLRGWAVVLVLAPEEDPGEAGRLRLARIAGKRRYAKVFLDLRGLGIRDLAPDGDDLLILAGPTMALRSDAMVLRWRGGAGARDDALVGRESLEHLLDLPYGAGTEESVDHPEGLTVLGHGADRALLVVYDSPARDRRVGESAVNADRFRLRAR